MREPTFLQLHKDLESTVLSPIWMARLYSTIVLDINAGLNVLVSNILNNYFCVPTSGISHGYFLYETDSKIITQSFKYAIEKDCGTLDS